MFFFNDHRVALLCWFDSYKNNLITKNSTLIHIDRHIDFCFNKENRDISEKLLELQRYEVKGFINKLYSDNSEFIVNAMVSTLIKNGITISSESKDGTPISSESDWEIGTLIKKDNSLATDKIIFEAKSIKHDFYINELECISGFDPWIHTDTNSLINDSESLILDIDLDFFTYKCADNTFSRNPLDIRMQILSNTFEVLFEKSNIITIALEPRCCGGSGQCINILEVFDMLFFRPRGLNIIDKIVSELLQVKKENYDFISQICKDSSIYNI